MVYVAAPGSVNLHLSVSGEMIKSMTPPDTAATVAAARHLPAGLADFLGTLASDGEPGLAVGVYLDGELAGSATAGCAVPEHGIPVTDDTVFDIASVSKHMTSACLLLLARDGLVDLDSDIRTWLPELQLTGPVTPRQCLTHTAGLRDYFALCELAGLTVPGITESRFMDLVVGQAELDFPAGSAFSYSNTGYVLAGVLVRRVTGEGLARYARERLFGPLGMAVTHFRDDVSLLVPRLACGYVAGPAGQVQQGSGFRRYDVTEDVIGDGAIVTTLADLAAWHSFMASGTVLGPDIRDGLLARQVLTDGTRIGYALGLMSIEVAGESAWWHSGSWAGYRAAVIYLPGRQAGISVLANRNDRYASHVALAVAQALVAGDDVAARYEALTGIPVPAKEAARQARSVAGLWHEPDQDVFLDFEADAGQVVRHEQGEAHRFLLGTDGSWHGIGAAAGGTYTVRGGMLIEDWGLSASPAGRYQRAEPVPQGSPSPQVPAGIFRNEELRAYADLKAGESGAGEIMIGLAAPRRLVPAGDGVWRSDGGSETGSGATEGSTATASALTVRVTGDGAALLVSLPGARHVRFDRVTNAPADRAVMRGLRGAG